MTHLDEGPDPDGRLFLIGLAGFMAVWLGFAIGQAYYQPTTLEPDTSQQ